MLGFANLMSIAVFVLFARETLGLGPTAIGLLMVAPAIGGVLGSVFGAWLFRLLQAAGQIDTAIAITYVLMLGSIGGMVLKESLEAIGEAIAPATPTSANSATPPVPWTSTCAPGSRLS